MSRQPAFSNGYAAHKKYDDAHYHKSYSERADLENRYVWGHQAADLIEDEKDDYTYVRKFEPRRSAFHTRQKLFRLLGIVAAVFFTIFYFSSKRMNGLGHDVHKNGKIYEIETVRYYDLEDMQGTSVGWTREERVLLCTPLRDAAAHLPMFFGHLRNFTYPHHLIDLAFLVSDSKDDTEAALNAHLERLQNDANPKMPFGEISIIHKDFGQAVSQDAESRHGFAVQASRRKLMAQARNWLLSAALRPYHSWVYWRDADVETCPFTIIEDLMRHDKDVIVPNVWRPLPDWLGGEQPYDLNSWQESETAIALAESLDEDAVIVEGYAEYATWRPHLAYLRDPYGDPDVEMELDGIGGVSILAKARVSRAGVHFPAFSFERHAETEGFGKMAKRMQFSVVGLPHYTIWHLYEPSVDDIKHMEDMDKEKKEKEAKEKEKADRLQRTQDGFKDESKQWEKDKKAMEAQKKKEVKTKEADAKPEEEEEKIKTKKVVDVEDKPKKKIKVDDDPVEGDTDESTKDRSADIVVGKKGSKYSEGQTFKIPKKGGKD